MTEVDRCIAGNPVTSDGQKEVIKEGKGCKKEGVHVRICRIPTPELPEGNKSGMGLVSEPYLFPEGKQVRFGMSRTA